MITGLLLSVLLSAAPAERPWAAGVGEDEQRRALALFVEGNALFEDSKYAPALAKYRDALALWRHPAIHFNAAVSLINLDQPLAALDQLDAAMAYGDGPFDAETYKQAQLYARLLQGQVSVLEVTCDEVGAEVTLDGERLFVGPGKVTRRLAPGRHQLVGRKAGFVTAASALVLTAGQRQVEALQLSVSAGPRLVRRWAVWTPWAVLGAGVLVAGVGVPLEVSARSELVAFESGLSQVCPVGCAVSTLPEAVRSSRARADAQHGAALGLFGVGAATLVTGVVMLGLNGLHPEDEPKVVVVPSVGPGLFAISGTLRF